MPEGIYSGASPAEVMSDLQTLVNFQNTGMAVGDLTRELEEKLIPHLLNYGSPEFQSMFNTLPEDGALLGAELALRFNQGVTNWQVSPGGAVLEELCCKKLCELSGLGKKSDATFMYSGTYGNQQAIYLALHQFAENRGFDYSVEGMAGFTNPKNLKILVAEDIHFSVKHAAHFLGLGEDSLLKVGLTADHRIDLSEVQTALKNKHSEYEVFCVICTLGSTITGSVDQIQNVTEICSDYGSWLHADGAYGLAYSLLPEKKHLFAGLESADSIVWDPHKQFGIPIPSSLLFLRDGANFDRVNVHSPYFNREGDDTPNPGLKSPPSTRPFSALPLVTSIKYQGLDGLRQRLRSPITAISRLAESLRGDSDIEVLNKPDTGIICFRIKSRSIEEDQLCILQEFVYRKISSEGSKSISIATINGKKVLRLVAVSPEVTVRNLQSTIASIKDLAKVFTKGDSFS